jgi:hypothetical protein
VPSKWLDAPQRRHLLYPKLTDLLIVKQNFRRGSVRKIANGIVSIIAPQRAAKWFWDYSSSIEDQEPVREFWDIPFVRLGRVAAVTGDSSVSQPAYVFEKLLGGKERSRALLLRDRRIGFITGKPRESRGPRARSRCARPVLLSTAGNRRDGRLQ